MRLVSVAGGMEKLKTFLASHASLPCDASVCHAAGAAGVYPGDEFGLAMTKWMRPRSATHRFFIEYEISPFKYSSRGFELQISRQRFSPEEPRSIWEVRASGATGHLHWPGGQVEYRTHMDQIQSGHRLILPLRIHPIRHKSR
jgi:hypothetical protein